jgi:hypothetical protein
MPSRGIIAFQGAREAEKIRHLSHARIAKAMDVA